MTTLAAHAPPLAYAAVRGHTLELARGLSEADCQVQSMPDASPVKWHLAHTTWFFETFVLEAAEHGFKPFHPAFRVLFNSYYNGIGQQHPRAQRGLVTRPSLAEVLDYRRQVDERMAALLRRGCSAEIAARIELGLQHEQQHQELILTDLQHLLSCNPLCPVYDEAWDAAAAPAESAETLAFVALPGGLVEIGHAGPGFAFDNETPRHAVHLRPCALASRLLTVGDWQAFVDDGGYRQPRWWLSAGWDWLRRDGIEAPLYWRRGGGGDTSSAFTHRFGLQGLQPLRPGQTLWHVSLYEADAYARWRSAQAGGPPLRLPIEAEWEHAAALAPPGLWQMAGRAWQWTASAYAAYPGFAACDGAVGEYNAKFMVDQYVLRGGSPATPPGHLRTSYRNFFPAATRWQFSGVRLAHDAA